MPTYLALLSLELSILPSYPDTIRVLPCPPQGNQSQAQTIFSFTAHSPWAFGLSHLRRPLPCPLASAFSWGWKILWDQFGLLKCCLSLAGRHQGRGTLPQTTTSGVAPCYLQLLSLRGSEVSVSCPEVVTGPASWLTTPAVPLSSMAVDPQVTPQPVCCLAISTSEPAPEGLHLWEF